jgi:ribosomal protein S30
MVRIHPLTNRGRVLNYNKRLAAKLQKQMKPRLRNILFNLAYQV